MNMSMVINIIATCGASAVGGPLSSQMMKSGEFRIESGKNTVSS
jgi:hypothetical protein